MNRSPIDAVLWIMSLYLAFSLQNFISVIPSIVHLTYCSPSKNTGSEIKLKMLYIAERNKIFIFSF